MKAEHLGSAGLTILIRCICHCRLYINRAEWAFFQIVACDNCGSLISYPSFQVRTFCRKGQSMEGNLNDYEDTPERREIIAGFEKLQAQAERLAGDFKAKGDFPVWKQAAHRALNAAQSISNQKCLLAQMWAQEDAASYSARAASEILSTAKRCACKDRISESGDAEDRSALTINDDGDDGGCKCGCKNETGVIVTPVNRCRYWLRR